MKQLKGRMLSIAMGYSELPRHRVDAYRKQWEAQGYSLPRLEEGRRSTRRSAASVDTRAGSGVGTQLKQVFAREYPGIVTCAQCARLIGELDSLDADDVRQRSAELAAEIAERAPEAAPKLWQRIAAKADQVLGTKQVEARVEEMILEACDTAKKKEQSDRDRQLESGSLLQGHLDAESIVDE